MPATERTGTFHSKAQDHGLETALDNELVRLAAPALERGERVSASFAIRNVNRTVGTILGQEITRRTGEAGLPDDTIHLRATGSAGQSFMAFAPRGLTIELEGEANDYFGKGLSGGTAILYPPRAGHASTPTRTSSAATSRCTAPPPARPSSWVRPASASACATPAPRSSWRASATTAAST